MKSRIVFAALIAIVVAARAQEPAEDPDTAVFLGPLAGGPCAPSTSGLGTKVILTNVAKSKEWRGVLETLRSRGFEEIVPFAGSRLGPAFEELAKLAPGFVAVVVPPDTLDVNFHFDLLERASRLDADPFIDFAFGYITGATAEEAEAFARSTGIADRKLPHTVLEFGPSDRATGLSAPAPDQIAEGFKVRRLAHEANAAGLVEALRGLKDIGVFNAWGHGGPDGVVDGLNGRELRASGIDMDGALYFSGPCYCGVTGTWYSNAGGRVERKRVEPAGSFLLALVKAGAGGVFAGLDPDRGETNHHEWEYLLMTGEPLGMVSKSTYDDVVLAYRRPRLELPRYEAGKRSPHRDIHDTMISGGACRALFGDPASRPFDKAAPDPFAARTRWTEAGLEVTWDGGADLGRYWMPVDIYRAEGRWTHRIRLRVDVPLDDARRLKGMKVLSVTKDEAPVRYTYATGAVEAWGGTARVHLMVIFPYHPKERVLWGGKKYEARFLLTFADHDPRKGMRRDRTAPDAHPRVAPSADAKDAAAKRDIPEAAMAAALAANVATRDGSPADEAAALERLKTFGRDGFGATLALLESGEGHSRTDRLLLATYFAGAEEEMLALADGPPLPNYGSWPLLTGLSVADTPRVRDYLLGRLRTEKDPGLYMCVAQALGRLGEGRATATVAAHIMQFEPGWGGVEPHLLSALARMGGDQAVPHLARFLSDERAGAPGVGTALTLLEGLDRGVARCAAAELRASPRFEGFDERLQAKIQEIAR